MSRARDWSIDLARLGAMAVVVLMHWTLARVTYTAGRVEFATVLAGPVAVVLTWVLQVMPLFFVAGGFTNTVQLDSVRRGGGAYGAFVGLRARRLLTPLLPLVLVMDLLSALLGGLGQVVGDQAANPLWFLVVYLVCVTLTPVAVGAYDRWGLWSAVGLLGCVVVLDVLRYTGAWADAGATNTFVVWLFCHQLGIAYARGALERVSSGVLLGVAVLGAGVAVGAAVLGPYSIANLGLRDVPDQNLMPPNLVMALLGVAQLPVLGLVGRRLRGWGPGERLRRVMGLLTVSLMPVYLWQLPALFVVVGLGMLAPAALLPAGDVAWWATTPLRLLLGAVVLGLLVVAALRWEGFVDRFPARTGLVPVVVAATLGLVGTYVLWQQGLGVATETPLLSVAAQLAVLAAAVLLSRRRTEGQRASRRTPPPPA